MSATKDLRDAQFERIETTQYVANVYRVIIRDVPVFIGSIYQRDRGDGFDYVRHGLAATSFEQARQDVINWIVDHEATE